MSVASGMTVDLHKSADPLAYFMEGAERFREGKKETCFIRYIGMGTDEISYISMIRRMDQMEGGYVRTEGLENRFTPEQIRQAQEEGLAFHFQDPSLEQTLLRALDTAEEAYRRCTPHGTPSMVNNFRVMLVCRAQRYLPALYRPDQGMEGFPHLVCTGPVRRQEYLFLYFLYLTGCHVLYMNPEGDIPGLDEELKGLSFLYEKPWGQLIHCQIPPAPGWKGSQAARSGRQAEGGQAAGSRQAGQTAGTAPAARDTRLPEASGGIVVKIPPRSSGRTRQEKIRQGREQEAAERQAAAQAPRQSAGGMLSDQPYPSAPPAAEMAASQSRPGSKGTGSLRKMEYEELARLSASVVMIMVYDQEGRCFKTGSGVAVSQDGYILTNCHVVSGGVSFGVRFENEEEETRTWSLVKYHTAFDLAVIRVERRCVPIPLAPPDPVVRGQQIVAIGSPLGLFNTISDGIVSGFRRIDQVSMIQFTAPISRGSSGGALLDLYGRLVGIITAGFDDGQNLNLAVDRDTIAPFAAGFLGRQDSGL